MTKKLTLLWRATSTVPFVSLIGVGLAAGMMFELPQLLPPTQGRALLTVKPVVLPVRDLDATARWYEEKLGSSRVAGLPRSPSDMAQPRFVLIYGENLIALVPAPAVRTDAQSDRRAPRGTAAAAALRVKDVEAVTSELRERGVEVVQEPRFSRRRDLLVSTIRDPEGRALELQQPL